MTVGSVMAELKRAGSDQESDALYREEVASAVDAGSIATAAQLAAERGDVEGLLKLFDAYERLERNRPARTTSQGYVFSSRPAYVVSSPATSMAQVMHLRADAKAHGDILRLLDRYLASLRDPDLAAQRDAFARQAAALGRRPRVSTARFRSGCRRIRRTFRSTIRPRTRTSIRRRSSCSGTPSSSTAATTC